METSQLIVICVMSAIVGAQIGINVYTYFCTRKLIKKGAAFWKIDNNGIKELVIINGRELERIMLQIADKSRNADYCFTIIQHPQSKTELETILLNKS